MADKRQHTPGPWRWEPEKLMNEQHIAGRAPTVSIGSHTIKVMTRNEADARLIASAPQLLAACQKALQCLRDLPCDDPLDLYDADYHGTKSALIKAIRAAQDAEVQS